MGYQADSRTLPAKPTVTNKAEGSDILDADKYNLILDKSNIVMLGPTGSGE
mgnify:FL=1